MPPALANAVAVCSCGQKFGNVSRAAVCEEMAAVEHALIAAEVPRMLRHFQLGHEIKLGENAPREFLATIARAAMQARGTDRHEAPAFPRGMLGPAD